MALMGSQGDSTA